jgi:hypothetical protein
MATATVTRPSAPATATATPKGSVEHTARDKAVATLVVGSASALTLGVFIWATWIASQISIPI